jgi:hypothetical protein
MSGPYTVEPVGQMFGLRHADAGLVALYDTSDEARGSAAWWNENDAAAWATSEAQRLTRALEYRSTRSEEEMEPDEEASAVA